MTRAADEIRDQAIVALIRAAERAERTGAPARAAASYATAAGLTPPDTREGSADGPLSAGVLWERAAQADLTSGGWAAAVDHSGRARDYYLGRDQARAAARAQATAGRALRLWGHHAEAREQLTAAVQVLRAQPDTDTVRALDQLAALEVFAGSPDADRLSTEALTLGQALDVDTDQLGGLLVTRGIYLAMDGRRPRGSRLLPRGRPAGRPGRRQHHPGTRPAQPVGSAGGHRPCGRGGSRPHRHRAPTPGRRPGTTWRSRSANLAQALLTLGDWDAAEAGTHPGHGCRRPGRQRIPRLLPGLAGGAARRQPPSPRPCSRHCETCGPARTPRTKQGSASWRRSPRPPAASRRTRCGWPAARSLTSTPSGSAANSCAGPGRWPPAPPTSWVIPPPPRAARAARRLPARAPGADAAGRTRPRPRPAGRARRRPGRRRGLRRRGRQPARAEHSLPPRPRPARPRPATLCACTMPKPPRLPPAKPATSPVGCAASRCWTGPQTSRPQHPLHRLRAARCLARTNLSRANVIPASLP